ncbi:MAG: GntR family transcriptional regulator [Azospirillaceae bacterium]|nr:GntR family transcriptional regulator [Azospirillaceae bacterium]
MAKTATRKIQPDLSVRQKTYIELKDLILSGQLRPAEHVSESRIATRLGVSRTPLREALMKLEKEGLVVSQRNVGYTVADVDLKAICDLLVVREVVDARAAELACAVASDDDLERVVAIMREMESLSASVTDTPVDAARQLELGLQIHRVIAEITQNEALIRICDQIYQQLQLALLLEVLWIDLGDTGLTEHRAITDALLARDPEQAAAAAKAHVRSSLSNMSRVRKVYELISGNRDSAG